MPTTAIVQRMVAPAEIDATFAVMRQLRPALQPQTYRDTIERMMAAGFRLAAVLSGADVQAVAGYRVAESLAWGRHLYVDDLVTADGARSAGFGKQLLDWLKDEARAHGCGELHLDSGVQRHGAHRFYLRERMDIGAYHFRFTL
ncbi:MAG TPA: GNAT family N-acetyltransferase [Polyangia bacterium]|jgi:GNAT superfamily N-acetyltransferase|nr:GNAT family N-acetyltransferase [Polyangia bacterium]